MERLVFGGKNLMNEPTSPHHVCIAHRGLEAELRNLNLVVSDLSKRFEKRTSWILGTLVTLVIAMGGSMVTLMVLS